MSPPAPIFSDRITAIAAELANLGKRPISAATFQEAKRLHQQLDALLREFVPCDRCGNFFPNIAQLTLDGRSANMCASCAITALQRGTIDTPVTEQARITHDEPKNSPEKSTPVLQDAASVAPEMVSPARPPVPEKASPTETPRRALPVREPRARVEEDEDEPEVRLERSDEPQDGEDEEEKDDSPAVVSARPRVPRAPRLVARGASNGADQMKASHGEVARYLNCPTRDVRQIAKLIEEISPPMDIPKTTRYVLAELRNARSKIPPDTVSKVVHFLKDGFPAGGDGAHGGQ
ncbi:MAG TPA: hypothetical protein P5569_09205 [Candidatus Latescibacteria bacterium]|nr:hypothetical protein [Candidatus Latescibacterota bacterium]